MKNMIRTLFILSSFIILPSMVLAISPAPGAISWWEAEWNTNDSIDGNHGTASGGVSFGPGITGQAFLFDGIDGEVNAGKAANLHVSSGEFSVAAWVNFNGLSNAGWPTNTGPVGDLSIVSKIAGLNYDGWRLLKQSDNRFWFCFGAGFFNACHLPSHTVFSTTYATTGQWYYVVVTKDATNFSMYVNGALEDSRSLPAFVDTNAADLLIGGNDIDGAHMNGLIDDATIYNRALSAAEIAAIYAAGITPPPPPPAHPTDKDQCKNDGYQDYVDDNNEPFKNQGLCIRYVNLH